MVREGGAKGGADGGCGGGGGGGVGSGGIVGGGNSDSTSTDKQILPPHKIFRKKTTLYHTANITTPVTNTHNDDHNH